MEQKFHVNPQTGNAKLCNAKTGICPFRGVKHYSTPELARNAYEQANPSFVRLTKKEQAAKRAVLDKAKEEIIRNAPKTISMTKKELLDASKRASEEISDETWNLLRALPEVYKSRLDDGTIQAQFKSDAENLHSFLSSDNEQAQQLRDFLGPEVELEEFSKILVANIRSMTLSIKWAVGKNRSSIAREILTSLDNDMTKERYTASVMFFGGRCCYCNEVLKRNATGKKQVTGEHITPISPENPEDIHGATRFGNMALACSKCNKHRGNKELVSWIAETDCIDRENKAAVLSRIEAFRRFALYSEYSIQRNREISDKIEELKTRANPLSKAGYVPTNEEMKSVRDAIKIALYDLKNIS
jgi:5-methylcytosine-specific restriction endonuclease McrA